MVLHYLNQFKSKFNSNDSPSNSQEKYKSMLQELNNIETILQIHAHKTGNFSLFLPEIRDLRLKLSVLKRLYPTPKKKMSFFTMQLVKMNNANINQVVSKPLEADFMKPETKESSNIIENEDIKSGIISKKKQKLEFLVQDRIANNINSAIKPQMKENSFKAPYVKETFGSKDYSSNINNTKDLYTNKECYPNKDLFNNKDPYYKDTNNNNKESYFNKEQYKEPYNYNKADTNSNCNYNNGIQQPRCQNKQNIIKQPQKDSEVSSGFITAKDQLRIHNPQTFKQLPKDVDLDCQDDLSKQNQATLNKKFQPPYKAPNKTQCKPQSAIISSVLSKSKISDDKLKSIDPKMIEVIENEILDNSPKLSWSDISGLEAPKAKIIEMIVWPFSNPEIFTGIRAPPRGLLLFGPPGTGKTMIGKAIASDTNFTFFSISASSLTSKWVGEGEKMVKTLFMLASAYQPAVVFIDEVDSLLCSRSENENEASRRIKTEFLCQMEGTNTNTNERLLLIGATNRPQELDDAALRRFVKKLYIPLPNKTGRREFLKSIIKKETEVGNKYELNEEEIDAIVEKTKGYSGADLRNLCAEAALNPLRGVLDISRLTKESLRATNNGDFEEGLRQVKPTVSQKDSKQYLDWNKSYGTVQFHEDDLDN